MEKHVQTQQEKENLLSKSKDIKIWKMILLFVTGCFGIRLISTLVYAVIFLINGITFAETVNYIFLNQITESIKELGKQPWLSIALNSLCYAFLLIFLSLIILKDYPKLLKSAKIKGFFLIGFLGYLVMIGFNKSYNNLIGLFYDLNSNINENSIESIAVSYPILSLFVFGIIGPICEELTYRVGLFNFLRKKFGKVWGYVLTGIIFGLIHFSFTSLLASLQTGDWTVTINELINLPTYIFAGLVFCYIFDKYGLAASVTAHIINNIVSLSILIILSIISMYGYGI